MMDPERAAAAASNSSRTSPYGMPPTSPFTFDRNMPPEQVSRQMRGGTMAGEMCDLSPESMPFYPSKMPAAVSTIETILLSSRS